MVAMDRQRLFHTNCSSFLSFTYKERTRHSSNKRDVFPVLTEVGDLCVAYKQLDSIFEGVVTSLLRKYVLILPQGHDLMVDGFTTTCAISAFHH